ncbi:MAG TPA: R3H domain-containing nucleic acid-binding protein [Candidatus Paceibacterota bacterium]|nr:R3H domain-containing nucleic acid-binding protein [Candidatus Paceibacterota bacterium]
MQMDVEGVLKRMLGAIGAPYKDISELEVAGQKIYMINVDDGKTLIGAHGDTIHAIDHLVKKIVEKQVGAESSEDEIHFLIDVNEYRTRQIRDLQTKALMMAERARSFQYDVELSPMSAYERLIVHTTLQNEPNVKTESQGEGRNRRVVIRYTAVE